MSTIAVSAEEQRALGDLRGRLTVEFASISAAAVEEAITAAHRRFDGGAIRDFVPLFVERDARRRLARIL
ncbi:hypothetical protein DK926_24255 [Rhodococcus sp. Eu-32]|uniref:three-helix bundle dimerization domain-containing protein n=1 Tax=Rhodococcus sp. Eu-32 TaxID=1017319 RepID=UPI000DF481AB|nr:hypothetical protein [Rhodococcus sp. Eu-32]RRQ25293.1 hypothetical protein DK926_24255 [Rhodococcus sp. Eu-32]